MANTINAITTGIGGLATTADSSGDINLQSAGSTVAAVTSTGVAVTGTLSATGNITQNGNAVLNAGTAVTVAQGGTGAASLTANNVILGNGTSAVQFVAPGSNGNIITSNGTTWVSSTPAGGGVTSLNGQTGAITNTGFGNIGSYVTAYSNSLISALTAYLDTTVAGSSLHYSSVTANNSPRSLGFNTITTITQDYIQGVLDSNKTSYNLSGTWRLMCAIRTGNSIDNRPLGLYVRIS